MQGERAGQGRLRRSGTKEGQAANSQRRNADQRHLAIDRQGQQAQRRAAPHSELKLHFGRGVARGLRDVQGPANDPLPHRGVQARSCSKAWARNTGQTFPPVIS